jgi:hypothetical protein
MDTIVLVDGTGRWWNKDYEQDMAQSFCSQMAKSFHGKAEYRRGPSDEGYRFNDKAAEAVHLLVHASFPDAAALPLVGARSRLFLAGYSRGAAIALQAAELLALRGIQVDGLFLFDPVERVPSRGSVCVKSIPQNVRFSRIASRSLDPAIVAKYEGTLVIKPYNLLPLATKSNARVLEKLPFVGKDPLLGNPIRPEFGTFIVNPCGIGDHQTKTFTGSHGALGGVGWADVKPEDKDCQEAVATWMNEAFRSLSLHIQIEAPPLTARFDT